MNRNRHFCEMLFLELNQVAEKEMQDESKWIELCAASLPDCW
jgi:hypothetical protein